MLPLIIAYLILSFMVALLARRTPLGFFRGFLFSVMMTPFLILLFLLILTSLDSKTKKVDETPASPTPDC
ncbi:MAG: hypothetical protein KGZ83_17095 [Sulfuricella sp.]|nr:hypothetical protein [Sulfuricella sp.]